MTREQLYCFIDKNLDIMPCGKTWHNRALTVLYLNEMKTIKQRKVHMTLVCTCPFSP